MSLFSPTTQAIFYNYKAAPVQRMLDFDYAAHRETPSVACIVTPGAPARGSSFQKAFFGHREVALPVYGTSAEASRAHPTADVLINYASYRSAYASSLEALRDTGDRVRTVVIIAEGVPERDVKVLIATAGRLNKWLIGPATVGAVQAGAFKVGDAAGTLENIRRCKLYRPGSVGFVSKSGGLSNEMYNVLARATDGVFEGVAVGGDAYPGSTLTDHVLRYERMPAVRMVVVLGELGGRDEFGIADAMRDGRVRKPVVAWVAGTCARKFHTAEVQFGHAGAKSSGDDRSDSAEAKNEALRAAGAVVPHSFEGFADAIASVFQRLDKSAPTTSAPEEAATAAPRPRSPRELPMDYSAAMKAGQLRRATNMVCTISDERGEEPLYAGVPISALLADHGGIGDVVSLLWFKRRMPRWATKFIEMCVIVAADHGPCVSGAHNAIVTARAGKDVVSSLCSGLLTIGPRFGGAVDDAALNFMRGCDAGTPADEFVEGMKRQGRRVEGIGHRIKSADNKDSRVELLSAYAREHFPAVRYLAYAESVEAYTLQKSANLVLNIDGCMGALFADLLNGCIDDDDEGDAKQGEDDEGGDRSENDADGSEDECESEERIVERRARVRAIIELGALNGLFVLARSIGFIGHALDQRRMKQPLYRHPVDDVLYAHDESVRWHGAGHGHGHRGKRARDRVMPAAAAESGEDGGDDERARKRRRERDGRTTASTITSSSSSSS